VLLPAPFGPPRTTTIGVLVAIRFRMILTSPARRAYRGSTRGSGGATGAAPDAASACRNRSGVL
jgi:hypothetical protein